jgi:hypothetical protein
MRLEILKTGYMRLENETEAVCISFFFSYSSSDDNWGSFPETKGDATAHYILPVVKNRCMDYLIYTHIANQVNSIFTLHFVYFSTICFGFTKQKLYSLTRC